MTIPATRLAVSSLDWRFVVPEVLRPESEEEASFKATVSWPMRGVTESVVALPSVPRAAVTDHF